MLHTWIYIEWNIYLFTVYLYILGCSKWINLNRKSVLNFSYFRLKHDCTHWGNRDWYSRVPKLGEKGKVKFSEWRGTKFWTRPKFVNIKFYAKIFFPSQHIENCPKSRLVEGCHIIDTMTHKILHIKSATRTLRLETISSKNF